MEYQKEKEASHQPQATKAFNHKVWGVVRKLASILEHSGLPLKSEGYERAKNILKGEYGKTSEIINAYVHNILELPILTSSDPKRVNAFYKTLLHKVQSLETLGKLERVNGMSTSVLKKTKRG